MSAICDTMYKILYIMSYISYQMYNIHYIRLELRTGETAMSHEERNTLASLVAGLLVNGYVILKLSNMFADGRLDGPDALAVWARAMLWVIPVGIIVVIICVILANILFAIITNDPNPEMLVDERDRAIQNIGLRFTAVGTSIGFIGGLIALAMGTAPLYVLIGMFFSFSLGDLAGNFAKMVKYRIDG